MTTPLGRLPVWRRHPLRFRRIQDVELAGRRPVGAQDIIAAAADDQELVAGAVGIDGHDVVAERPVEAGGRRGGLYGDLLV